MDENITCMSCYKRINADYVYCFMCNRKKNNLTYCAKIKQNGHQCKFKCLNDYCYYHRKYAEKEKTEKEKTEKEKTEKEKTEKEKTEKETYSKVAKK